MTRRRNILSLCSLLLLVWWWPSSVDSLAAPLTTRRASIQAAAAAAAAVAVTQLPAIAADTADSSTTTLRTGVPAPAFTLPNNKESTTSLSSLVQDNDWIVLYFYPGAFSPGCTLEAQRFQKDLVTYQSQYKAQIVGVSVDPPAKQTAFCSAEGLQFPLLSDAGGRVSKLYGATVSIPGFGTFSNRQTYLIDARSSKNSGIVQWVFQDVENRIPQHSQEVLEKLKELTAGAA